MQVSPLPQYWPAWPWLWPGSNLALAWLGARLDEFSAFPAGQTYTLDRHIKAVHEQERLQDARYSCHHCHYTAGQKSHLDMHLAAKHDQKYFNCDLCTFRTKWKSRLKSHLACMHQNASTVMTVR